MSSRNIKRNKENYKEYILQENRVKIAEYVKIIKEHCYWLSNMPCLQLSNYKIKDKGSKEDTKGSGSNDDKMAKYKSACFDNHFFKDSALNKGLPSKPHLQVPNDKKEYPKIK
jgi:hypothetical protein